MIRTHPAAHGVVDRLIEARGLTFGQELGLDVPRNRPADLFGLLVFALLASARISHRTALHATEALFDQGWTTARKMARSTWRQRTDTLNRAGYARYDESTARMLGETCDLLMGEYHGDLRRLREAARHDPGDERRRLRACKGIGDVGVDIFFREAQAAWDELYPFADGRALRAAERLGLGADARELAGHLGPRDFARLVTALVRVDLEHEYDRFAAGSP